MTKILIVDDDKLTRQSLAETLKAKGIEVIEAVDGKAGLKKALHEAPTLIVTDIRMPEMDGVQMVEELRKDPKGKDVPVIIMTNDEQTATLNKALEAGVTVYLSKTSTSPDVLPEQIVTALRQSSEDQPAEPQK
jgi:CheY-like chemotaxis protein